MLYVGKHLWVAKYHDVLDRTSYDSPSRYCQQNETYELFVDVGSATALQ